MENLNILSISLTTLLDKLEKLTKNPKETLNNDLSSILDDSSVKIFTNLNQIKKDFEMNKKVTDDLIKERDLLMASKVMMTDRSQSFTSEDQNKIPNFNDFFFKEVDGIQVQMKNIISNLKSDSKIRPDKILQINALCLFLLEYIKRNGMALRNKFKDFEYFGKFGKKHQEKNEDFDGLMAEVQKYMQGDSKRLNSMLNTFEFKQNFSLYEQNIKLKKLNFRYSKKIKKLNKRVNILVRKFSEYIEKKQFESNAGGGSQRRSRTTDKKSRKRALKLDFARA